MKNIEYKIITIHGKRYVEFPFFDTLGMKLLLSTSEVCTAQHSMGEKIHMLEQAYQYFGSDKRNVFAGYQVHGTKIAVVTAPADYRPNAKCFHHEFEATDGLLTDNPKVTLITKFADCTPVVFYAPKERILCSLHSGWRGTQQKISEKAIQLLHNDFGLNPAELITFIGPSIGKSDFEVSDDLIEKFNQSHGDISSYLEVRENRKYLFDMRALLEKDLLSLGIGGDKIYTTSLSTVSDPMMHSYRRDGARSGRMLLLARMMK